MSDDLEKQLRESLRPIDPERGFADRVMARIETERRSKRWMSRRWLSRPWVSPPSHWVPVALAASAILAVVLVHARHVQQERQGLEARQQLIEALRVTGEKLDLAYRVVNAESQSAPSDDTGA
jgi:negative regulator of sigma E activity